MEQDTGGPWSSSRSEMIYIYDVRNGLRIPISDQDTLTITVPT